MLAEKGDAVGGTTALSGSPAQTGLATACYRYVLTGTNTLVPPAVTLTTAGSDAVTTS